MIHNLILRLFFLILIKIKAINKYKDYKKDKDLVAKALVISRATLYRKIEKNKKITK